MSEDKKSFIDNAKSIFYTGPVETQPERILWITISVKDESKFPEQYRTIGVDLRNKEIYVPIPIFFVNQKDIADIAESEGVHGFFIDSILWLPSTWVEYGLAQVKEDTKKQVEGLHHMRFAANKYLVRYKEEIARQQTEINKLEVAKNMNVTGQMIANSDKETTH